jgi:hypothetical protein
VSTTDEQTRTRDPLDEIRQREQAATPGPWGWYGNTDTQDIHLATRRFGRSFVMRFGRWGVRNAQPLFAEGREWGPDPRYPDETEIRPHGRMTPAKDLPVFEVAPGALSRGDQRVYRADLIGIRNPDAEFIAHSREDVSISLLFNSTILVYSPIASCNTFSEGPPF